MDETTPQQKKTKSSLTVNAEYAALRLATALLNALPYGAAMALADAAGWLGFSVLRYRRARTLGRIRAVFPEKTEREVRAIALASLRNLIKNAVEMMRASSLDRAWMDRHVVDGMVYKEKLQSYVDEGHGVVIMVPHSGNWYMAAWSMAKYGLSLFAIAARQRNPKVEAWMKRQYGEVEVLDRDDKATLFKVIRGLRSARAFAILPDLRVWDRDVEADFLGGKANVSRAGAAFAVKCGSPIVVAQMYRENGRHVFNHIATLRPNPDAVDAREEAARLTRETMRLLDEAVRQRPGDWFWYNKRWILEPVHDD